MRKFQSTDAPEFVDRSLCALCVSIPGAILGASLIGGGLSAGGSIAAANTQANAANNAANMQLNMFNQTRQSLLPFMNAGTGAVDNLTTMLGGGGPAASANMLAGLRNYPGYQFALQQGQQALDRTAAAKGLLLSGGQLKDSMSFNQGMADQLFNQFYNQNMGIAQLGENAAAGVGQQGLAAAQGAGQAGMLGAGATAQGINNATGSLNNTLNNALLSYALMNGGGGIPSAIGVTPQLPGIGTLGGGY